MWLLAGVNVYAFLIMWKDKQKARKRERRISERRIFTTAMLGGALGIYLAMKIFRHKTKHKAFTYGIPLIILIQILLFISVYCYINKGV